MLKIRSRFLRSAIISLVALTASLLASCTKGRDSDTPTYRIPYIDEKGQNTFRDVTLLTLHSAFQMDGAAAHIYFNPSNNGQSFTGSLAEPHLGKSGNIFRALDPESGTVIATYAFYEKMFFYEKKVLLPGDSQISWPRTIGVYSNVERMTPTDENNAAYLPEPADITEIMPFSDSSRDALAFNHGVLGHEHFHAHFEHSVQRQLASMKAMRDVDIMGGRGCPGTTNAYELKLLAIWNEGLADFYGAITSEQPSFMTVSFGPEAARPVAVEPQALKSAAALKKCRSLPNLSVDQFRAMPKEDQLELINAIDPHLNGAQLARAMYAVAERDEFPALGADSASLNKWQRAARYLIHRLNDFKLALDKKTNWESMQPDYALCFFFKDLPLSATTKALVNKAFSSDYPDGVAQCGSL